MTDEKREDQNPKDPLYISGEPDERETPASPADLARLTLWAEGGSGGTEKIQRSRERSEEPDETSPPRTRRTRTQKEDLPKTIAPTSTSTSRKPEREQPEQGGTVTQERRSSNPFWTAINTARRITARNTEQDQPGEWAALQEAMGSLDEDSQRSAVHMYKNCVLNTLLGLENRGEYPIQGLFAIARSTRPRRMTYVAHLTAVLRNAIQAGELTAETLRDVSLARVTTARGDRLVLTHRARIDAFTEAIPQLEEMGFEEAADVLRQAVAKDANRRFMAMMRKKAEGAQTSDPDQEEDEVEPPEGNED